VINNPFQMVVLIVLIVMVAGVLRARYSHRNARMEAANDPETLRMKEELKALRDRVAVLERIATEKESLLEREIEQLRDR
jgi:Tfp pilus assembly protein PilO